MRYSDKIGLRIRFVRETKGYSQEYMAELLDICQSTYANLELGKTNLSIERLLHITTILDMDIHQLFESSPGTNPVIKFQHEDKASSAIHPDTKFAYDQLILELRTEVDFLRSLVKQQHQRL